MSLRDDLAQILMERLQEHATGDRHCELRLEQPQGPSVVVYVSRYTTARHNTVVDFDDDAIRVSGPMSLFGTDLRQVGCSHPIIGSSRGELLIVFEYFDVDFERVISAAMRHGWADSNWFVESCASYGVVPGT